ncbi:MAG: metalloregulator ArsR/SmtB family transcription factor [Proteobacteria bacterium]|nr:metalloregulator ArsR/SmtB family transcription factor [Pseudomonadota bacterium]MBU1685912.1 metalloregulator ArsR/SmtB family transcription factor [Pseudomonadota bacterium]
MKEYFTRLCFGIKLKTEIHTRVAVKDEHVESVAALLKTMSHPLRLKILCLLQEKEMAVGDIRDKVKTTNANVSQHLSILRNQGIIGSRKEANYIFNRITDTRVLELIATMSRLFCQS